MKNQNNSIQKILKSSSNPELIERAFNLAETAHQGQKRASGEDYIFHPLKVASVLNEMKLDPETVAAGLLHDVPDDTEVTIEEIEKKFGKEISFLVAGVSKLGKIRYPKENILVKPLEERAKNPVETEGENLRRMFFAMAEDLRVILIKLADRLCNMETLSYLPRERQKRIALETLEIFTPIADRLGMGEMKMRLEDLSFPYLYPQEYQWLIRKVKEKYEMRKKYLDRIKPVVKDMLEKEGIKPLDIQLRAKSYWSLYQKLLRKEMNFEKIYDLIALRIIVDSVEDCYKTLGILHKRWRPLPGEIKDFIALPKPNGYQSLHTVCFCLEGRITEFQIRTLQMHETAENGICAHWAYKEKIVQKDYRRHFRWVSQLREWQKEIQNSKDFFDGLKFDFFRNRIFVFTPKGEVIDLPERATPIDFAFAVHTEIGNQAVGAKINGKIASLSQPLKNGDKVEILRDKNKRPSRDWLEFVKTGLARSQIKKWLKERERPENLKRGLSILNRDFRQFQGISFSKISQEKKDELLKVFPYKNLENLIVAIGEGELSSKEIIKVVFKEILTASETQPQLHFPKGWKEKKASVYLGGANGILINLAKCCSPQPGDKVKAYITKTRGATLHKVGCENLKRIQSKWPQRIIEASWTQPKIKTYEVSLRIKARDRIGLFRDITSAISTVKINMILAKAEAISPGKSAVFDVKVEIGGWEDLDKLFGQLKEVKGVKEITRI